jgi:hypothetical protein
MVMVNAPIAERILMNAAEGRFVVIEVFNKRGASSAPCFLKTLKYFDYPLLHQPRYLYRQFPLFYQ